MEVVVAYIPLILRGAVTTLHLFVLAFFIGAVGGLLLAIFRTSPILPLRWFSILFIAVMQGTPPLLQLFIVHFGLALLGLRLSPLTSAVVALSLFAAGFLGEIWRGAIQSIPKAQWDASRCLGFSRLSSLAWLIMPQAIWVALPATVGFAVSLLKTTSLAAIIGISDLTKTGMMVANISFEPMLVYGLVAAIYFSLCWPLSIFSRRLERIQNVRR